jgi:hypothetical protein
LGHLLANAAHRSIETGTPVDFEDYLASQGVDFPAT